MNPGNVYFSSSSDRTHIWRILGRNPTRDFQIHIPSRCNHVCESELSLSYQVDTLFLFVSVSQRINRVGVQRRKMEKNAQRSVRRHVKQIWLAVSLIIIIIIIVISWRVASVADASLEAMHIPSEVYSDPLFVCRRFNCTKNLICSLCRAVNFIHNNICSDDVHICVCYLHGSCGAQSLPIIHIHRK